MNFEGFFQVSINTPLMGGFQVSKKNNLKTGNLRFKKKDSWITRYILKGML